MPRIVGPKLRVLLSDELTRGFVIIRLGPFADGTYFRETTDTGDVIFNAEKYLARSTILSIDTPKIVSGIDKGAFKLGLIDENYTFREKFRHGVTGTKAELRALFIDVRGYYEKDQPLLEPENTMIIYSGTINKYEYAITDDSLPIANLELASPMGSLDLTREMVTSQNWIRQKYPTDTSFDNIYEGSKQVTMGWGKKT
jgi:hypothetical protein